MVISQDVLYRINKKYNKYLMALRWIGKLQGNDNGTDLKSIQEQTDQFLPFFHIYLMEASPTIFPHGFSLFITLMLAGLLK